MFHGYLIDQIGPGYYNIPHPSTQRTNQAGTSHQEATLAGNDDVQVVQSSSEQVQGATANHIQYNPGSSVQYVQQLMWQVQNQMVNFDTSGQIPSSDQKIASLVQRICRDTDPNIYNQRLQAANQQRTQQIEITQGYHYGTYYNTLHMIPNLGYQGT